MIFRLVSKSVTLNDLEWRNGPYSALFHRNSIAFVAHCVKVVEDIPKLSATEMTICGYTILVCASDSGQLSLLLSVRLEVNTGQRTADSTAAVLCGWEGNRRSGVAPTMCHSHLRIQLPKEAR